MMINKRTSYENIKKKRLLQIYYAVQITVLITFFQRLFFGHFEEAFFIMVTGIALLPINKLMKKKKTLISGMLLISVLTLLCTYFMWSLGGIYDEVVLMYPCILIVATIIGNKKFFISLTIFLSCSLILNGLSNHFGWHTNKLHSIYIDSTIMTLFIIWLTGYTIWMLSNDVHFLLKRLSNQHHDVIQSKEKIKKLLHHDILTGLPNRVMAQKIYDGALSRANRKNSKVCVIFIDIDSFKKINDGLGHQAGDALLKELARRLKSEIRNSDFVCRFAGDEFVIIIESVEDQETISRIASNLINVVKKPYYYQTHELICSCSIGISIAPDDEVNFDLLIQHADTAMYRSKSIGGNSFHFFSSDMAHQGSDYLTIISDLRKALKESQFTLYYQPKLDLVSHKIIGAEALIRWKHPEKGLIFPDNFITQAEKSGLIIEIGQWVLRSACKACQSWLALGYSDLSVAVNVSQQQFKRNNFANSVVTIINEVGIAAKHVELEMTESLLVDNSVELNQMLRYLNKFGVSFSIDDFGTGYSNLSYLKEFEIEILKIDRSFIHDIDQNPKNRALVVAIIQMAKALSMKVVAEGVESQQIANILTDLECDFAQGYYWSKPVPEEQFIELLKQNRREVEG